MSVSLMEMYCQGNLCKFRAHSKERGNPHPEYSARTTNGDSSGNTGDIPVPTVPANAVQTAWKGVMEPSEASFFLKILPQCGF